MKSLSELPDYDELRKLWKQEPIAPPEADLELTPDSWLERGVEVVLWSLGWLEYWLSGNGWLRAWLRFNLFVAIVLSVAGVLMIPAVAHVLEQTAQSSHWFAKIVGDLVSMITSMPPVLISIGVIYLAFLLFMRVRRKRLQSHGHHHHDEDSYFR